MRAEGLLISLAQTLNSKLTHTHTLSSSVSSCLPTTTSESTWYLELEASAYPPWNLHATTDSQRPSPDSKRRRRTGRDQAVIDPQTPAGSDIHITTHPSRPPAPSVHSHQHNSTSCLHAARRTQRPHHTKDNDEDGIERTETTGTRR